MRVTDEGASFFLDIVVKNFDRPPPSVSYADSSPTGVEPALISRLRRQLPLHKGAFKYHT
jgi:hypothetical protein